MFRIAGLIVVVAAGALTGSAARGTASGIPPEATVIAPADTGRDSVTQVRMRDVNFYVDPEIALHIHTLRGTMAARNGGTIVFDDKRSFIIRIASAEVGLKGRDLSALLNKYVFAYPGAPLKDLAVTTNGSEIVQRGVLHKGIDIPFEIHARLDVTPDGLMRMHPVRTRILGVNGDALMHAFGLSLEKLLDLRGAHGATVHGNDIYLDPTRILPPPAIEGRVTAVRVEGDEVVQQIGAIGTQREPALLVPPDSGAPSYMYYRGGTLRFGRMFMVDADMQIVPLDRSAPFAFDLDRYNAQLVAGYSRTLANQGLEVFMRDLTRLGDHGAMQVTLR